MERLRSGPATAIRRRSGSDHVADLCSTSRHGTANRVAAHDYVSLWQDPLRNLSIVCCRPHRGLPYSAGDNATHALGMLEVSGRTISDGPRQGLLEQIIVNAMPQERLVA